MDRVGNVTDDSELSQDAKEDIGLLVNKKVLNPAETIPDDDATLRAAKRALPEEQQGEFNAIIHPISLNILYFDEISQLPPIFHIRATNKETTQRHASNGGVDPCSVC